MHGSVKLVFLALAMLWTTICAACTKTRTVRVEVPVAVPVEACRLDVEGPLPEPPQRTPCPPKPEGYAGDWPALEVCYDAGEAWRLRELVRILVDVYQDAVACERAAQPTP